MDETGLIEFANQPVSVTNSQPLAMQFATQKPTDAAVLKQAEVLQSWLITYPGVFVKPAGWPGQRTTHVYRKVTGSYLPGDPRA